MSESPILAIPTNIITGFLGVGKTTAILNLLRHKPSDESWAVLVNEFGEVGVDGSLFQGGHTESQGVFIREVPGGCMCCTAGLPMQVALNQLLTRAKPQRLLIEPTGLGHPKEVLEVLSADHYQDVLNIQQCITLVDARKISDPRYTEHDTFNQQIDVADIVVGNKEDLYAEDDRENLIQYVANRRGQDAQVHFTQQGGIQPSMLEESSTVVSSLKHHHHDEHHHHHDHHHKAATDINDQSIPECGFLKVENAGEGYESVGWRFSPDKIFNRQLLFNWMSGLKVERAKGVFITSEGIYGYNLTLDALTELELDDCLESRIEIIASDQNWGSEQELLQCVEAAQ